MRSQRSRVAEHLITRHGAGLPAHSVRPSCAPPPSSGQKPATCSRDRILTLSNRLRKPGACSSRAEVIRRHQNARRKCIFRPLSCFLPRQVRSLCSRASGEAVEMSPSRPRCGSQRALSLVISAADRDCSPVAEVGSSAHLVTLLDVSRSPYL